MIRGINGLIKICALFSVVFPAYSEVVRDGSIGSAATDQPTGPDYTINESMGQLSGNNLFHSFSSFSLSSEQSATFTATSAVSNVISRVTGNSTSQIDGSLNSTIAGANLYFLNPNGVIFGETASVNVLGSFHVSTGDYLKFDDSDFSVSLDTTNSVLSSEAPSAFGFLSNSPAPISIDKSKLEFEANSQLSLIGGDINITSAGSKVINLPGGQVKLVSVGGAGEIPLEANSDPDAAQILGTISLQGSPIVETTVDENENDDAPDPLISVTDNIGGSIIVRSKNLSIRNFSMASHSTGNTDSTATGIDFEISNNIVITGNSHISSTSEGSGKAGSVLIKAQNLTMRDDAEILSDTFAGADGSEVRIEADTIELWGDAEVGSDVEENSVGNGGEVNVVTRNLIIGDEAEISTDTAGAGKGGNVTVTASESVILETQGGIFADTQTDANAGNIIIISPKVSILGVEAEDISDDDPEEDDDSNEVDDDPFEAAGIYTISTATGNAGDISIETMQLEIREEGAIAASAISGNGGNITINSHDRILVQGGGIVANVNQGIGGNINLKSAYVQIHDAEIVAQAGTGQGGSIVIDAKQYFSSESLISASAGPAGISGTVTKPTAIDLSSSLVPLDTNFEDTDSLFHTACKVRGNIQKESSFIVVPQQIRPSTQAGLLIHSSINEPNQSVPYALISQDLALLKKAVDESLTIKQKAYAFLQLANYYVQQDKNQSEQLLIAYDLIKQAGKIAKQLNDARLKSFVMGNLALLYSSENRLDEALFLSRQALQQATKTEAIDARYRWHWLEGKILWRKGKTSLAIAAYMRSVNILSESRLEALVDSERYKHYFEREIEPIYLDLVESLFAGADLLTEENRSLPLLQTARDVLEGVKIAELRDYFEDPCVAEVTNKTKQLDQLTESTAIIYPIALDNRLELLVSLPSGLKRVTSDVSKLQLSQEVNQFRARLKKINSLLYREPAKKLYNWLIKPIQETLKAQQIKTLVFVPGPIIRSVPVAALYSGKEFLVEQYALAIAPSLSLVDPKPINKRDHNLLLAGLSQKVHGYAALSNVNEELNVVNKLYGNSDDNILLNQSFVASSIRQSLTASQPSILHIASHAEFGEQRQDNFILAYDGPINLGQLSQYIGVTKYREQPLELLILSACETAKGNNKAALGLAGASIQAGARSVMGSLWKINDAATLPLIKEFYSELVKPDISKAVALQKAQLHLIQSSDFNHPYYWSSMLMINNWL